MEIEVDNNTDHIDTKLPPLARTPFQGISSILSPPVSPHPGTLKSNSRYSNHQRESQSQSQVMKPLGSMSNSFDTENDKSHYSHNHPSYSYKTSPLHPRLSADPYYSSSPYPNEKLHNSILRLPSPTALFHYPSYAGDSRRSYTRFSSTESHPQTLYHSTSNSHTHAPPNCQYHPSASHHPGIHPHTYSHSSDSKPQKFFSSSSSSFPSSFSFITASEELIPCKIVDSQSKPISHFNILRDLWSENLFNNRRGASCILKVERISSSTGLSSTLSSSSSSSSLPHSFFENTSKDQVSFSFDSNTNTIQYYWIHEPVLILQSLYFYRLFHKESVMNSKLLSSSPIPSSSSSSSSFSIKSNETSFNLKESITKEHYYSPFIEILVEDKKMKILCIQVENLETFPDIMKWLYNGVSFFFIFIFIFIFIVLIWIFGYMHNS